MFNQPAALIRHHSTPSVLPCGSTAKCQRQSSNFYHAQSLSEVVLPFCAVLIFQVSTAFFFFLLSLCVFPPLSLISANSVVSLSEWMKNKPKLGYYRSISQGLLTKKISSVRRSRACHLAPFFIYTPDHSNSSGTVLQPISYEWSPQDTAISSSFDFHCFERLIWDAS